MPRRPALGTLVTRNEEGLDASSPYEFSMPLPDLLLDLVETDINRPDALFFTQVAHSFANDILHNVTVSKRHPTISDLNDLLKKADVIDVPSWRHTQLLADLRNLCDHNKKQEPTPENIDDLISGVAKISKTVF